MTPPCRPAGCCRRERVHRLRTGQHRLVDVLGFDAADLRGVAAARHGAAGALEVVAGRAVGRGRSGRRATTSPRTPRRTGCSGVVVSSASGIAGPVPSWRRTPRARRSRRRCRRPPCAAPAGPAAAIGIRPVPTWKSTAAAPTSVSDGPNWSPPWVRTPSPFWPWQNEQPTRNSSRPRLTSSSWSRGLSAWAGANDGVETAGQQQPEQQYDQAGDRSATVPREAAGGAVQEAHIESLSVRGRLGYLMR